MTRSSRARASSAAPARAGPLGAGAGAGAAFAAATAAGHVFFHDAAIAACACDMRSAERPASAIAFSADGALATSLPEAAAGRRCRGRCSRGAAATAAPDREITPSLAKHRRWCLRRPRFRPVHQRQGGHLDGHLVGFQLAEHFVLRHGCRRPVLNQVETVASVTDFRPGRDHHIDAVPTCGGGRLGWRGRISAAAGPELRSRTPSAIVARAHLRPPFRLRRRRSRQGCQPRGEGTSTVTLSVSSSQSISSTATASPGFLNQVATVASVTDSPKRGHAHFGGHDLNLPFRCSALRSRAQLVGLCVGWPGRLRARPRWRDRHSGAGMLGLDAGQHPLDIGFDKGPGALVLGLFLTPDHLGPLKRSSSLIEADAPGRDKTAQSASDRHVVDAARVALFQQGRSRPCPNTSPRV